MRLPGFGQPIARMDIDLDALDGVVIAAPAGGDILVYDGVDTWRNRTVTGDITISATGVVAIVPGTPRQILQTDAAGLIAEWTSNMDGVTIGAATPAPGTFNTLTKTGTTGLTWPNVSDEDYEIFFLSGVTGGPRLDWDESVDLFLFNKGIYVPDDEPIGLGSGDGSNPDVRLYYDGTDTFWDLRAVGTGALLIALGAAFPSPVPNTVHIWNGNAGAIPALDGSTMLTLESAGDASITLQSAATRSAGLLWYDPGGLRGQLVYDHNNVRMGLTVEGVTQWFQTDGTLAFQKAMAIITTVGDLSFGPAGNVILTAGQLTLQESIDSAAVADEVSLGRYEIGVGNTVLAISQETAVAADADETKFSNKVQVRINGATYFIMLTTT